MKRGEVWTLQDTSYASKARPVVIVQSDDLVAFDSVILCLFTTFESENIPTRVCVEPTDDNGLEKTSYVMTDKIVTVDRKLLGFRIGELNEATMDSASKQLAVVLEIPQNADCASR